MITEAAWKGGSHLGDLDAPSLSTSLPEQVIARTGFRGRGEGAWRIKVLEGIQPIPREKPWEGEPGCSELDRGNVLSPLRGMGSPL